MGGLAAVGGFGIGTLLLERGQPGSGKADIEFEPEIGLESSVAQLTDLRSSEGIALTLGESRGKQQKEGQAREGDAPASHLPFFFPNMAESRSVRIFSSSSTVCWRGV